MEVHYTCQPSAAVTTASAADSHHAQPPWLLDLSATPPPSPKRKSTTTTTTTTPTSTTSTEAASTAPPLQQQPQESLNNGETDNNNVAVAADDNDDDNDNDNNRLLVLESIVDHCPPVSARGLFWNWTRVADTAIQPCPGGSSGFAKWRCSSSGGNFGSSGDEEQSVSWSSGAPDLSECESHWLTRLKTRLRENSDASGELEDDIAAELAENARSRALYGGDVARVADLMQALVHRVRQQQQQVVGGILPAEEERRSADLSRRLLEAGSHLLEDGPAAAAWADLVPAERAAAGSDLVAALTEAAALQADSIVSERTVAVRQANIVAAVRVMRASSGGGDVMLADQRFRTTDEAVELVVAADSLNSDNGAVRLMFFYYHNLDHVLPSSTNGVKFLNSQVAGATLSKKDHHHGHHSGAADDTAEQQKRKPAVTATFRHIEETLMPASDAAAAACVWWDFVSRAWAEAGCWVAATNRSHTVCQCGHLATIMAVLMAEDDAGLAAPHDAHQDDSSPSSSTMTVVIAAIVSVVICVVTVAATLVIFRRFAANKSGVWCRRNSRNRHNHNHHQHHHHRRSWPCMGGGEEDEERGGGDGGANCGGYYPYLSSSTTTTTLTPGTPGSDPNGGGLGNSAGQYCLGSSNSSECQVLRPLMITPLGAGGVPHNGGGATTIYRATFANGQQAHVIPIMSGSTTLGGTTATKNFRPITPSASHIYMEIDPVYNTNSETLSDILVSDLSDDDLRRSANGGCSSTTTSSSSDDSRCSVGRRFDGRNYLQQQQQQHHLPMLADHNNSGLLCEQQQQQQQRSLVLSDFSNSHQQPVMMIGGAVDPLPITAAAYGGQHLLRLDLGGGQQHQHQQQLYPTAGRFVGHSFGHQGDHTSGGGGQQHLSWQQHPRQYQQQHQHHSFQ